MRFVGICRASRGGGAVSCLRHARALQAAGDLLEREDGAVAMILDATCTRLPTRGPDWR
jgi:hypothetical protein